MNLEELHAHMERVGVGRRLLYTPEQVRLALEIGTNAIYELLHSGRLRALRNGHKWLIPASSIVEYINASLEGAA
ncbi:helix-turn-helix domain-containing protein [Meiothermus granaticius]|uniref:DNA binding domain, excisionase family n=1 Tax=Meiothermus granaticius NBRC 107808 TaxID=1227551 RepID=A0A399FDY1_9DEIN|nr:helix-turn-helix domain-containing protein [Meiothermus granaticius]RIH94025.1 DNA binding domain, excisionase family [Meiothermus granaticius NBRC 107808]GEM88146.1 hypothetical protein MGR01S_27710 [Meiothermus granaticius NBRC 107808]